MCSHLNVFWIQAYVGMTLTFESRTLGCFSVSFKLVSEVPPLICLRAPETNIKQQDQEQPCGNVVGTQVRFKQDTSIIHESHNVDPRSTTPVY